MLPFQIFSDELCLFAVRSKSVFVNGERLAEQRGAGIRLAGFVHEHSEVRDISRGPRPVRTVQRGIDRDRAAEEKSGLPQVLLIPENVGEKSAGGCQLSAFRAEF